MITFEEVTQTVLTLIHQLEQVKAENAQLRKQLADQPKEK